MAGVATVDFRAKELEVWRLLLEFDLSLRQLRVMGAVLKRSFGRGERSVRVPAQRYLAAWTGMAEEHVSVALAADYQALRGLCEHCGISVEDAQSGCREQRIVERRHLVMRRLHAEYG